MNWKKRLSIRGSLATFAACMILMTGPALTLAGCRDGDIEQPAPAAYGTYGSALAQKIARSYPLRSPGSTQERQTSDLLVKTLEDAGYDPQIQPFTFTDREGVVRTSRNIIVRIPGQGFTVTGEEGKTEIVRRQVIVGAHYDTLISEADLEAYRATTEPTTEAAATPAPDPQDQDPDATPSPGIIDDMPDTPTLLEYDGIHDNASGVAALITLAKVMQGDSFNYDVILVAFGAGEADQAGARFFAGKMSRDEVKSTDAMYCMDAIYAGDKIYAHAGRSSVKLFNRKDYELRRKLYEATDVFYEHELYTNNGYMLYTNQSSLEVEMPGLTTPVLYREWSLHDSDYLPFDSLGIPIVFFESYDYDSKSLEDMKESKNPAFSDTDGWIRHTAFDSADYLTQLLNQKRSVSVFRAAATPAAGSGKVIDQLTRRINNTAFIILEAIRKGAHDLDPDLEPAG